ncbi:MAG: MarR family EPS-associated transcriptional regulator [Deltaproteobacteria bacterium]|nr:MarR family EPS-associated transcriptional regulator [Deltaproteobacteria bacterium]
MKDSEKTFQILDTLDRLEISTQRQLSDHSGISLGQVNYLIKSLLEKGLIKIGNFRRNPHKIGYVYFLTPKGIEAKSRLAVRFVTRKLKEYDNIRNRLAERIDYVENRGFSRMIFIGPAIVKDFIVSIFKERNKGLDLIAHYTDWKDLYRTESDFDAILLFTEDVSLVKKIRDNIDIPSDKIFILW